MQYINMVRQGNCGCAKCQLTFEETGEMGVDEG